MCWPRSHRYLRWRPCRWAVMVSHSRSCAAGAGNACWKLCLLDTSARPDTPEQVRRRELLITMSREGKFKGVTPRLLPMLIHPDRLQDKDLTGLIMTMAERVGRDAFVRQQTAILKRPDSRPFLKSIKCPVQVIGGRQDAITPPEIVREIR